MYSTVVIFVITVVLNILLAPALGDMLMQSKTYKVRAMATNKEGKLVNVSGTLMDFKLLLVSSDEGEINNNNYTFSIVAKEVSNETQDNSDTDYYELDAFPISDSQMSGSNRRLPNSGRPKNLSVNSPVLSLSNKNSSRIKSNKTQTQFNGTENPPTAKFDNVPETRFRNLPNTRFTGLPPFPLFKNISSTKTDVKQIPTEKTQGQSTIRPFDSDPPLGESGPPTKCMQNDLSAGGLVPQTSQLNLAQLYPKSSTDKSNNNDKVRTRSTDAHVPSQTFHTEQSQQVHNANVMESQSKPNLNVFNRKLNSEMGGEHGPHADDTPSYPLRDSLEKVAPAEQVPKVQNISLTTTNNVTSVDLAPVGGEPWTNQTDKNNATQTYANESKLNLLLPLQNVSVSSSSLGDSSTAKYASLDAGSILQNVEPVNGTIVSRMVEDYLDSDDDDLTTLDDMVLMKEIIDEVDTMMNDQPNEVSEELTTEDMPTRVPFTIPELVKIHEVIGNDDEQEIVTEDTTKAMTSSMDPSTISYNYSKTDLNGSNNVSTNAVTTNRETVSGTANGNKVASSRLVVSLIAVSIIIRAVINQ